MSESQNHRAANQARIPSATYRMQFNSGFTFKQAADIVDYLYELGVDHCYASPVFSARQGSSHGYDVIDHSILNPEIGGEESFIELAQALRSRDMGLILDVVPNHMCIVGSYNRWWNDVLENGPSSPYASYFDIDWKPPKPDLIDKVLLPVLGDQYGRVLENQEITISFHQGAFFANYYDMQLPIAPRSYRHILEPMLPLMTDELGEHHPHVLELESILTALSHLPLRNETYPERIKERRREKEIIKWRLDTLATESENAQRAIENSLRDLNGTKGARQRFDRLERLLADQAYRLSFWRVAADEINYRRFFDINELAAIRVEDNQVFAAVHEPIMRLIGQGFVTGLRIDHVDGLFDPVQYLIDLQAACLSAQQQQKTMAIAFAAEGSPVRRSIALDKPFYIVVEKILSHCEVMRPDWPVHGTTGYGFLNQLNGVFVETANEARLLRIYERVTGETPNFPSLAYECKNLILRVAMSSELHVMARRLDRISEQHRFSRDFTLNSLQYALAEVIACFPVYRSYTRRRQTKVCPEDRRHILAAISDAKRRNPATSPSVFDFISQLLLLEDHSELSESQRNARRDFILRFQQITGPVMAKGVEDTAFYRRHPLASLNEVGGEPQRFGIPLTEFHNLNLQRMLERPHGLSATTTHDTKRSEDVRARINVLSEVPSKWYRAVHRWQTINRDRKSRLEGVEVPDANEEYLLYQTLIGAWPLEPMNAAGRTDFSRRIQEYLIKAMREAKLHTSWINPNEGYERAMCEFIEGILKPDRSNRFLKAFSEFHTPVARAGMYNSLAQTLLKITSPGVPDFYQGTEIWDFSLVDPDNRRPVDFGRRRDLLVSITLNDTAPLTAQVDQLLAAPQDGRIKLYLMSRALRYRRAHRSLFEEGVYHPLFAQGQRENHVIAFARSLGDQTIITAAGRFFTSLCETHHPPIGDAVWNRTYLAMGQEAAGWYRDILTGREILTEKSGDGFLLPLPLVFAHLPIALLERVRA